MATTITTGLNHAGAQHAIPHFEEKHSVAKKSAITLFFKDLAEDVFQKPLQARTSATHDIFREHINAMAICYLALIVGLIAASLLIYPYIVPGY